MRVYIGKKKQRELVDSEGLEKVDLLTEELD